MLLMSANRDMVIFCLIGMLQCKIRPLAFLALFSFLLNLLLIDCYFVVSKLEIKGQLKKLANFKGGRVIRPKSDE